MHGRETNRQVKHLKVVPRRYLPRLVFWPILVFGLLAVFSLSYAYLDRNVWHGQMAEFLPAETEFYAIIPIKDGNEQFSLLDRNLAKIPNGQNLADLSIEKVLFENNRQVYKKAVGDYLTAARVNGQNVFSVEIKDGGRLQKNLDGETYLYNGQKIYFEEFYAWRSGDSLIFSKNKQVIESLIDNRRAIQKSYRDNWFKEDRPSFLSSQPKFSQTFNGLSNHSLARVYGAEKSIAQMVVDLKESQILSEWPQLTEVMSRISDLLGTSDQVMAVAVHPESDGIKLEVRQMPLQPLPAAHGSQPLAEKLPKSLSQAEVDLYIEVDDTARLFASRQDKRYQALADFASQNLNIDIANTEVGGGIGRSAVVAGVAQDGQPIFAVVARHQGKTRAGDFAAFLAQAFKPLADQPYYEITDEYLVYASNKAVALEIKKNLEKPSSRLSSELHGLNIANQQLVVYLKSRGLVKGARHLIKDADSNIWSAVEALGEIMPVASFVSRQDGQVIDSGLSLTLNEVPLPKKREAEKFLDRLKGTGFVSDAKDQQAIHDSTRRADLLILQNSIGQFINTHNRAPDALAELVPNYIASEPLDPSTGQPYPYQNQKSDKTFFAAVRLLTQNNFGQPGLYCLTSKGIEINSQDKCTEQ